MENYHFHLLLLIGWPKMVHEAFALTKTTSTTLQTSCLHPVMMLIVSRYYFSVKYFNKRKKITIWVWYPRLHLLLSNKTKSLNSTNQVRIWWCCLDLDSCCVSICQSQCQCLEVCQKSGYYKEHSLNPCSNPTQDNLTNINLFLGDGQTLSLNNRHSYQPKNISSR